MVESVALEMRSAGNGTEGSNPSLSSIFSSAEITDRPLKPRVIWVSGAFRIATYPQRSRTADFDAYFVGANYVPT